MAKEHYLKTNELNESVKALEIVAYFLPKVISENYFWKWIIIALHNAVQGFMVCALKGSNGLNVLKDNVKDKWLDAYRNNCGNYPIEILDTYLNLYKKTKGDMMVMYFISRKFIPQGQQGWSIKKLNFLRNKFIHFLPEGWFLEISGLPDIINDCISFIDFLSFESGNIWMDQGRQGYVRGLIAGIKRDLVKIKESYTA